MSEAQKEQKERKDDTRHGHDHDHEHDHEHTHACGCCGEEDDEEGEGEENERVKIFRMVGTALLMAAGFVVRTLHFPAAGTVSMALFLVGYLLCGYDVILHSVRHILHGKVFDECFLMSVATIGAILIGEYAEGAAVMLFYQLGETLQDAAAGKSRRAVKQLLCLVPETVRVLRDGAEVQLSPREIAVGDVIVLRAGEKVPVDGTALTGGVSLDTSAVTGESAPLDVAPGSTVISGCIVCGGALTMRAEKIYADSTAARILALIEEASEKKAKPESFVRRFSKIYTPVVVVLALLIAFVPPLVLHRDFYEFIHRGLVFLVVSCPCALVLSIPIAYFAGIGAASSRGILVKGGNDLDVLSRADTVVFDKTGTLTKGTFEVTEILPADGVDRERLIALAVLGESKSDHPIARSVCRLGSADPAAVFCSDGAESAGACEFTEVSGRGTACRCGGRTLLCGSRGFLEENKIAGLPSNDAEKSSVYVAFDGAYAGRLLLSDTVKTDSAEAIAALRGLGFKRCVMLTGDNEKTAAHVAKKIGISEVCAGLLPQEKAEKLRDIMSERGAGKTVFVGDGINDAPVIAAADVGVAMGSFGSDAAIEAADVVLMTDEPKKTACAVKIAQAVRKKVTVNITFILTVKAAILLLSALGYDSMWLAVFADIGTALIATANSVAILRKRF